MEMLLDLLTKTKTIQIGICSDETLFVFQIARFVIRIIQVAVPFALIIWGSLDFFKAVVAGDEKEMKMKRKPFIQRLIAAVVIIILPILVDVIVTNIGDDTQSNAFSTCWKAAGKSGIGTISLPNSSLDD